MTGEKRRTGPWRLGAALAMLLTAWACGGGETRRFASIGTAGTGGVYYPLGGALARMLGERVPTTTFTAEVTGGSVENLNRILAGDMDLGMAMGTTLVKAAAADVDRYAGIRIVAPLYSNVTHVLVSQRSGISSLAELRGRRVSVGPPGSGTEQLSRDLLDAAGLGERDVEARYLSFSESASALRDGAIDAAILSVGFPAAAVLEATTSGGVALLGLRPEVLATLLQRYPYYDAATLPAGAYPGLDAPRQTFAVRNWMVADADLDDAIVTAMLDILRDRRDELSQVNEIAGGIDLVALDRAPLPLHAAAAAWRDAAR